MSDEPNMLWDEWSCGSCGMRGSLVDSIFHDCLPEDPDDGSAGVPAWVPPYEPSDGPAVSVERELVGASS